MEQLLQLKADAALVERDGRTGVSRQGRHRMARDSLQEAILRHLAAGARRIDEMTRLLETHSHAPPDDPQIALALAGFILDFSDFLYEG